MKTLNKILKYNWILILTVSLFITSCDDEDDDIVTGNSEITSMVPLGKSSALNTGLPDELIRVEGFNIKNLATIRFDNRIEVGFNPALNSNVALFFNVPFSLEDGSRFGEQEIQFVKNTGEVVTKQFEIIQPEPVINANNEYEPAKAVGGETLTVFGDWFINVTDVSVDGESLNFTVVSENELNFIFPEGKIESTELVITTEGGTVERELPIEGGFITYLLTNFDGDGVIEGNWTSYGDNEFRLGPNLGVDGSIGGEIIWNGEREFGFTGCTSEMAFSPVTTGTDAKNAFIVIDVNIIHSGTVLEFTLTDNQSDQWLAKPPSPEGTGWQTIEIPIATFGNAFTPDTSDQNDEDPNPSTITKVNVQISQEGGSAPVPSGYMFDNIRIKALEL